MTKNKVGHDNVQGWTEKANTVKGSLCYLQNLRVYDPVAENIKLFSSLVQPLGPELLKHMYS